MTWMKYHVEFDIDIRRNPYKGLYVAIEGIDGSGKTTQIKNIVKKLSKIGHKVVITGEPRPGQKTEKLIREILASKIKVPSIAFQNLYSADRVLNHKLIVEPALKEGKTVISHRNFWSAITHGIVDRNEKDYNLKSVNHLMAANGMVSHYHQFLASDFTFYLDISIDTAMRRLSYMQKKGDLYEKREKLGKIAEGYRWVAKHFPKEITVIDGEKPVDEITEGIINKINFKF